MIENEYYCLQIAKGKVISATRQKSRAAVGKKANLSAMFKLKNSLLIICLTLFYIGCKKETSRNIRKVFEKKHTVNVYVYDEFTKEPIKGVSISMALANAHDNIGIDTKHTNQDGRVTWILNDIDRLFSYYQVNSINKLKGAASINCLYINNDETNPAYWNYYIGWNCYSHVTYGPIGYSHAKKIELSAIESNVAFTLKPLTAFKFEYKKTSVGDKYVILNFDCLTTDCNVFSSGIPRQGYGTIFNYNKGLGVNFSGIVEETKQDYITKNNDNIKLKSYTNSTIRIDYTVFDANTNQKLYDKQDSMKLVNGTPLIYTIEY